MTFSTQRDVRITIISKIWAYATVMLFLSIFLNNHGQVQKAFLLPATIVFGATISTIVVLRKLRDRQSGAFSSLETLEKLNQRIENLEAIAVGDAEHWNQALKQLDQTALDRS